MAGRAGALREQRSVLRDMHSPLRTNSLEVPTLQMCELLISDVCCRTILKQL